MTEPNPLLFGPDHDPEQAIYHYVGAPAIHVGGRDEWCDRYTVEINGVMLSVNIVHSAKACGTPAIRFSTPNDDDADHLVQIAAIVEAHKDAIIRACRNWHEDCLDAF